MIFGIGCDICSVSGIEESFEKFGHSYAEQFCTDEEIARISKLSILMRAREVAMLFSAKEAVAKGLGRGFHGDFWFDDIDVRRSARSRYKVRLSHSALVEIFGEDIPLLNVMLTCSADRNYAISTAIVTGQGGSKSTQKF